MNYSKFGLLLFGLIAFISIAFSNLGEVSSKEAHIKATLADFSYGKAAKLPQGYDLASKSDMSQVDLEGLENVTGLKYRNGRFFDDETGFGASIIKGKKGDFTLSFRGTENLADMSTNLNIFEVTQQQKQASYLSRKLMKKLPGKLDLVGHSKGGNLAQYAGALNNLDTVTFNTANLTSAQLDYIGPNYAGNIVNIVHQDDPLHALNKKTEEWFGTKSLGKTVVVEYKTPEEDKFSISKSLLSVAKTTGGMFSAVGFNILGGSLSAGAQLPQALADHSVSNMAGYLEKRANADAINNANRFKTPKKIEEFKKTTNPWEQD